MLEVILSVITVIAILALIAWLVMQPQSRVLKISLPLFIISFILIYCIYLAASLQLGDPLLSVASAMKAFVESYQSVAKGIDYSSLAKSPVLSGIVGTAWFETFFWFLHMLLFAMLTVSGFAVLGRKAMDLARLKLAALIGKSDIYHIFGSSEGALQLGQNIAKEHPKALIVFYSKEYSSSMREEISGFGGALIEIDEQSEKKYLRKARKENPVNVAYFSGLHEEIVNGDKIADLLARKAIRDHAPYKSMGIQGSFPEEAYSAIIVGFGSLGQACAKWLIENAQLNLNGKKPQMHIVGLSSVAFQRFMIENPSIEDCAEISFLKANAYTWEFRDYLIELLSKSPIVPNVFVCVSPVDAKDRQELEGYCDHDRQMKCHIVDLLKRAGAYEPGLVCAPILENKDLWTPEIILHSELDTLAMAMNGMYSISWSDRMSAQERQAAYIKQWGKTSTFSKDSSRASCDFLPAMLALAGVEADNEDAGEQLSLRLEEDPSLLERLGRIEHNRWTAFHCVNGYSPMAFEDFASRVEEYLAHDDEADVERPHIDSGSKEHVCIVPWEQLPELDPIYARYDKKIANGETTLQGRDCDNVKFLVTILEESSHSLP